MAYEYNKVFKLKKGTRNEEIKVVEILKYMGWSYEEYLNTPELIVDTIMIRMDLESKQK